MLLLQVHAPDAYCVIKNVDVRVRALMRAILRGGHADS
ncbi:MAG: hypothetical protein JWN13_4722 [Betaproteobacteria bacterium]|jgi:hypothetical protein|nr:hypothetical protein [Betaproteobacteria bacterium]